MSLWILLTVSSQQMMSKKYFRHPPCLSSPGFGRLNLCVHFNIN